MDFEMRVMQKLATIDERLRRIEEALLGQGRDAVAKSLQEKPKQQESKPPEDWDRGK